MAVDGLVIAAAQLLADWAAIHEHACSMLLFKFLSAFTTKCMGTSGFGTQNPSFTDISATMARYAMFWRHRLPLSKIR